MPTGVFQITDIPEDKVETVIADFQLESPPPQVERTQQSNGLWTVTATFPGPGSEAKRFTG